MTDSDKAKLFLDRFHGRRDVFGVAWESPPDENGNTVKGYSPSCAVKWQQVDNITCYLRKKVPGKTCANCEIKQYTPVTEDSVLKHIQGDENQSNYLLFPDGTVFFAGFDFDKKPGKEEKGYDFNDVKKLLPILKKYEIPYGIARSTTYGYHVYFFFDKATSAARFRAFAFWLLDAAGLMEAFRMGIKPMPEIFPKQTHSGTGLGNSIKPPMIEPQLAKGRNCFVTDDDAVIEDQWNYLAKVVKVTDQIDKVIEAEKIEINEISNSTGAAYSASPNKWQPALAGSIEKVLEGCKAFRRLNEKLKTGHVASHFEGMALYHLAMSVKDGVEWFRLNVPGWGKTDQDWKQLQQSQDVGYKPWTCKKLQENGICVQGTRCFEKKPPLDRIEGQLVERVDIPESSWPEPSPVRYAYSAGDDYLKKLIDEVEELKSITNEEDRAAKLAAIVKRSTVFDVNQQNTLKEKITASKLAKKSNLNKQFSEARAQKEEEFVKAAASRTDTVCVGGNLYQKISPYGYSVVRPGNGDKVLSRVFCSFDLVIEEERTLVGDDCNKLFLLGKFKAHGREIPFEISDDVWNNNDSFNLYFLRLAGTDFNLLKSDTDILKQVVFEYDKKSESRKTTIVYGTQGWHGSAYITPSVIIDATGVKPNTEKPVDVSKKEHACNIDFKLLDDSDFKDVLFHIKTDLFTAFPRHATFMGIGHAMMAPFIDYLGLHFKPILWFEGDSGSGKSQLCILIQNFFGNFRGGASWRGSSIGMSRYGHDFKDALLLADDYKATDIHQTKHVINTIHNAYEYSVRGVANRDGTVRASVLPRCLFIMSGEVTPENEASFIARLVLVEYPKFDQTLTKPQFDRCFEHVDNYRGITPRFIHWALQRDKKQWKSELELVRNTLQKEIAHVSNSSRIANNIGLSYVGWKLFVIFMQDSGVLDDTEAGMLIQEGWEHALKIREHMVTRCVEEAVGAVFVTTFKELLLTGRIGIRNLPGFDNERAIPVGFVTGRSDDEPNIAFIYPGEAVGQVKKSVSGNYSATVISISNQLRTMGIIIADEAKRMITEKRHGGTRHRIWRMNLAKLGICQKPQLVQSEPEKVEVPVNQDGLI